MDVLVNNETPNDANRGHVSAASEGIPANPQGSEQTYNLRLGDSGMNPQDDEREHNIITRKYTVPELMDEVEQNGLTHLAIRGHVPLDLHLIAPDLTHLSLLGADTDTDTLNSISKLSKLEELDLEDNDFSSPEALNGLSSLKSLRKLILMSCNLKSLPDSISKLSKLEELNLRSNDFSSPEALNGLSSLKSLRKLNLRLCRLESLPDSFSRLDKLKTLVLGSNSFKLFPSSICELKSLETLHLLFNHDLQSLDPGVQYMSTLKVLNIYGCHSLKSPPNDICRQGLKAIQTFYRNSAANLTLLEPPTLPATGSLLDSPPVAFHTPAPASYHQEGSLYGGEITLSTAQKRPFLVRIGDRVNTVSDNRKRKLSESSDEAEPDREHGVKRDEKKPLLGIVSLANKAVKLLPYMNIHKTMTEKSFCVDKVFHQPE